MIDRKHGGIILWIIAFLGSSFLLLMTDYPTKNNTGHTGLNPYLMIPLYIVLLILSIIIYRKIRKHSFLLPLIISSINSIFGVVLAFVLVEFGILQLKTNWIHSGMNPPPDWSNSFLRVFMAVYLLSLACITIYYRKKRNSDTH